MTATVTGGSPITMNVKSNQFGYRVPVTSGTNTLVVRAADAAGHATSNIFTLVCGNRYQFAITSPAAGSFINATNVTVTGYVSAMRDANLPSQTNVVSVTVNGVGTTLGGVDGNGNRSFTTTNDIPVPIDGSTLTLSAVVEWADGTKDPVSETMGHWLSIRHDKRSWTSITLHAYPDCPVPDYHPQKLVATRGGMDHTIALGVETTTYWSEQVTTVMTNLDGLPSAETLPWTNHTSITVHGHHGPPMKMKFGEYHKVRTGLPDCDQFDYYEHWDDSQTITAPLDLIPGVTPRVHP